jgi:hypothetical protein
MSSAEYGARSGADQSAAGGNGRSLSGVLPERSLHLVEEPAVLGTVLLVILILLLVGALPTWPHSAGWGYYPSSGLGLLLIVIIVLLVSGRI